MISLRAICPLCAKEGKHTQLEPIFAIPAGQIAGINPMFPNMQKLTAMFEECLIKDLAYCPAGHGVIDLQTLQSWNNYRDLIKKAQ